MKKIVGRFEEQRVADQHSHGCDHGARGVVLVDCDALGKDSKGLQLVWRRGGKVWGGRGMPYRYGACQLEVVGGRIEKGRYNRVVPERILVGGRLSMGRIRACLPEIRKWLGIPLLPEHVDPKRTFVVESVVKSVGPKVRTCVHGIKATDRVAPLHGRCVSEDELFGGRKP